MLKWENSISHYKINFPSETNGKAKLLNGFLKKHFISEVEHRVSLNKPRKFDNPSKTNIVPSKLL